MSVESLGEFKPQLPPQEQQFTPSFNPAEQNGAVCDDQEFSRLNDRVNELDRIKQQQAKDLEDAQRKMACAEWEHAMSEAVRHWYHMRCEDSKASQALQEAQERSNATKTALKKAEETAQQLHQHKPLC